MGQISWKKTEETHAVEIWLNNKTQIIKTLRELFMELPGIKHVRAVVKSVKHTVEHHVIEPIHHKITQVIHGITNRLFHFSNSFIQWAKPINIPKKSVVLNTEIQNVSK